MRVFRFSVAATPDKMRKGKGDEGMRCGFRVLVCACPHRRPTRPPPPHVANRGHEPRTHGLLFVLFLVLLPSFSSPAPPPSHLVAQSRSQDERHEIVRDEVDVIHVCHMCVFSSLCIFMWSFQTKAAESDQFLDSLEVEFASRQKPHGTNANTDS